MTSQSCTEGLRFFKALGAGITIGVKGVKSAFLCANPSELKDAVFGAFV